jgi:rfaE bifunctional protein kinase chain/domain
LSSPAGQGLRRLLSRREPPTILVVGDTILDRYVWGEVRRISPEAPVPVVRVQRQTSRPGGAANVAANLRSLGATVSLVGVAGRDSAGRTLRKRLERMGVRVRMAEDADRRTTVKTRIVARSQQVARVDRECDAPLEVETRDRLRANALEALREADAVVVSDYDKGVIDAELLASMLPEAHRRGRPVIVDPKLRHFWRYEPATVISPNEAEAGRATASEIRTDEDCARAAGDILDRLAVAAVLVTRGERGMLLAERGDEPAFIPAVAREVYDVTGAGDTVVAVLALAIASGASPLQAAWLADHAGGLAVARLGTSRITLEQLRSELGTRDGAGVP